ncbi:hypothetical protein SeLEV6574_g06319 [Synchytrium endobioticum]|uniref:Regulator of telomere elongation helicase 1 homolog n=1 Tax=Synchytrium endobioticum TaxID=286115 RepID=A0A507CPB3_9FUNG|nr:hypothetical protein SeLEV6574_g06319 [Synchytrium endobioticum]
MSSSQRKRANPNTHHGGSPERSPSQASSQASRRPVKRVKRGADLELNGIQISFPFKPYDCQIKLMESILQALQSRGNALIESPTGTGKTLCLLCSVLAWRDKWKARKSLHAMEQAAPLNDAQEKLKRDLDAMVSSRPELENWDSDPPTIYYASRTHSQLSQAVRELKNSSYNPIVAVLGSREQMCLHEEVRKAPSNAAQNALCRKYVQKEQCVFKLNVEKVVQSRALEQQIRDIEDTVAFGLTTKACAYFLSREATKNADVIFLPYNYLVNATTRENQKIDVSNAILIFDEGHNLEGSCSDATSIDITTKDLSDCVKEAHQCMNRLEPHQDVSADEFALLGALLQNFVEQVEGVELNNATKSVTKPGEFMFQLFNLLNINHGTVFTLLAQLDAGIDIIAQDSQEKGRHTRIALTIFRDMLTTVFPGARKKNRETAKDIRHLSQQFKVHIAQIGGEQFVKYSNRPATVAAPSGTRTLSFWCFSSGIAMRDLVEDKNIRSVILASGTLSPLDSFACELAISFPIRLENPHVIEHHQLQVSVVSTGPSGHRLNSSYENRNSIDYLSDMGNSLVNFARIIPDGLLVFFPSYPVMNACVDAWKLGPPGHKSTWERIRQNKEIVIEPKNKNDFTHAMDQYYDSLNDPKRKGACFFAVCRGKASEGLDFSDAKARAVVICGIPFPAAKDPKVLLKKQYLDGSLAQTKKSGITALSGNDWYKQQAARAVNQAIGRVIRHRRDYGAIILADERFAQPQNVKQLPLWVRPYVKIANNFGQAQMELIKFFKNIDEIQKRMQALEDPEAPLNPPERSSSNPLKAASRTMSRRSTKSLLDTLQDHKTQDMEVELSVGVSQDSGLGVISSQAAQPKPMAGLGIPTSLQSIMGGLVRSGSSTSSFGFGPRPPPSNLVRPSIMSSQTTIHTTTVNSQIAVKAPPMYRSQVVEKSSNLQQLQQTKLSAGQRSPAEEYVAKVKRSVPTDVYKRFQAALRKFQAGLLKITGLIDELVEIFTCVDSHPAQINDDGTPARETWASLLLGFRTFLTTNKKKEFDAIVSNLGLTL